MTEGPDVRAVPQPRLTDGVVVVRPETGADAEAMTAALSDRDTSQWLPSVPYPYAHEESLTWIGSVVQEGLRNGTQYWFAVADPVTDAFLGEVGVRMADRRRRTGELGCWLVPAARGHGLLRRALTLLVDWSFTDLDLERLDWGACAHNVPSVRAALALGFTAEGVRRNRCVHPPDPSRHDEWVGGLLREEWNR